MDCRRVDLGFVRYGAEGPSGYTARGRTLDISGNLAGGWKSSTFAIYMHFDGKMLRNLYFCLEMRMTHIEIESAIR